MAQYPLDCGRKAADGSAKSGIVAVTVAEDGSVDYDALVKQGSNANKIVATKHSALVPKLHDRTAEVRLRARAPPPPPTRRRSPLPPPRRTWLGQTRRLLTPRWPPPGR